MTSHPWYQKGLHFQCTGCGDCCTGAPGYVWVNKAEIEALAELLKMDVDKFQKKYVRLIGIRKSLLEFKNGDCVFFDNERRGCKVYDARPSQCRTWPFWDSILHSPEAWDETADHCPGCNRGPLVAFEEIERQRQLRRV
jgi:Fe-S-cluster containining protein